MYVCLCRAVTDRDIEAAVDEGARSLKDLSLTLGVATQCGKCSCHAKQCLSQSVSEQTERQPVHYVQAAMPDMAKACFAS